LFVEFARSEALRSPKGGAFRAQRRVPQTHVCGFESSGFTARIKTALGRSFFTKDLNPFDDTFLSGGLCPRQVVPTLLLEFPLVGFKDGAKTDGAMPT